MNLRFHGLSSTETVSKSERVQSAEGCSIECMEDGLIVVKTAAIFLVASTIASNILLRESFAFEYALMC